MVTVHFPSGRYVEFRNAVYIRVDPEGGAAYLHLDENDTEHCLAVVLAGTPCVLAYGRGDGVSAGMSYNEWKDAPPPDGCTPRGHLRAVVKQIQDYDERDWQDCEHLRKLKVALKDFNAHTGRWKVKPDQGDQGEE